jgi:hypothetical protein
MESTSQLRFGTHLPGWLEWYGSDEHTKAPTGDAQSVHSSSQTDLGCPKKEFKLHFHWGGSLQIPRNGRPRISLIHTGFLEEINKVA